MLTTLLLLIAACSADGEGDGETGGDATGETGAGQTTEASVGDGLGAGGGADAEPSDTTEPAVPAGTLIWVHDQEPPDLHLDDPENDLAVTSWIRAALLEGLFGVGADLTYHPELLDGEPALTVGADRSVRITYTLREGLTWSDGTPLTSSDVAYTHGILVEGCATEDDGSIVDGSSDGCVYQIGSRTGYDLVTDFEVVDDRTFTVSMAVFFAGWKRLYSEVYAAHAFGSGAASVNVNLREWGGAAGLPSSGPMIFDGWERGDSMSLVRNDRYHGSTSPDAENRGAAAVEGVRIDFVAGPDALVETMLDGGGHVVMTDLRLSLEPLARSADIVVASSPGPLYEHWGLNVLNQHLSKAPVREAMAYVIDKRSLVDGLYRPLLGDTLPAEGLGNAYWMVNQPDYEDHQRVYEGNDIEAARALLEAAGYRPGADGIYVHPVDGRLSLRVGTQAGNELRERQQELLRQQFDDSGIEIVIDNLDGTDYFRQRLYAPEALAAATSGGVEGDPTIWDVTQFAWSGGPWPGPVSGSFLSGSPNNPYGFASAEFDVQAVECDGTIDDAGRAECYNELDRFLTTLALDDDGLFIIPLTQKPSFYGYRTDRLAVAGVAPDVEGGGPLANVVDFRFR